MNSEARLFDHNDFGEAFIGVAKHAADMTQLDRMIFEDCVFNGDPLGGGKVLAPHFNIKEDCRYHLRPEAIQRRIRQTETACTFAQAVSLCDAWAIIEATDKMVDTFILWIKAKKSTEKAVDYFENLAMQLAQVEASDDDFECLDSEEPFLEETYAPTETVRYHPIGHDESEETETWESRQPFQYRKLLARIRTINNLDKLKIMGKNVFEHGRLNHDQSGVFWYEYKRAKDRILKHTCDKLSPMARMLMKQLLTHTYVRRSDFGRLLYKIQAGEVKVEEQPSRDEWTIIWNAYHKAGKE